MAGCRVHCFNIAQPQVHAVDPNLRPLAVGLKPKGNFVFFVPCQFSWVGKEAGIGGFGAGRPDGPAHHNQDYQHYGDHQTAAQERKISGHDWPPYSFRRARGGGFIRALNGPPNTRKDGMIIRPRAARFGIRFRLSSVNTSEA